MCDVAFCIEKSEYINPKSKMQYCGPHAMFIGFEIKDEHGEKTRLITKESYIRSLPNYKSKEVINIEKKLDRIKKVK